MKTIHALLLCLLSLASIGAQAETLNSVKINGLDECYAINDNRSTKPYYMGFYLDAPGAYRRRVYLWLDSCPVDSRRELERVFVGHSIKLELGGNGIPVSNWDPRITNYTSVYQMIQALDAPSPAPIEFSESGLQQTSGLLKLRLKNFGSNGSSATAGTNGRVRLSVNVEQGLLTYANSSGDVAMTQNLSLREATLFANAIQRSTETCPIEVTIDAASRRVIKVLNQCVDLSQAAVLNNQG